MQYSTIRVDNDEYIGTSMDFSIETVSDHVHLLLSHVSIQGVNDHDNNNEIELYSEDDDECIEETTTDMEQAKVIRLFIFFLMMFQTIFHCSDAALNTLMSFFAKFIVVIGKLFQCEKLESFAIKLPHTIIQARAQVHQNRDDFKKYVCCPKCSSIFIWDQKQPTSESVTCSYVQFPQHPQMHHRQPCGERLFKRVKTNNGVSQY